MDGISASNSSTQAEMTTGVMKKAMHFQADMVSQLINDGAQTGSALRSDAMAEQGKGINLNTRG